MKRARYWGEKTLIQCSIIVMIALVVGMQFCLNHAKGSGPGSLGQVLWSVNYGDSYQNIPAMGDINNDGQKEIILPIYQQITCISDTGTIKWSTQLNAVNYPSMPVLAQRADNSSMDIFVYGSNSVFCIYGTNGSIKWQITVPSLALNKHAAADVDGDGYTDIIVATSDNRIHCISGSNGSIIWSSAPAVNAGSPLMVETSSPSELLVLAGSSNGSLTSFFAKNGSVAWSESLGLTSIVPLLACDAEQNGSIDVIVQANTLACISALNGSVVWQTPGISFSSALASEVTNDGVMEIVGISNGYVYCISAKTGMQVWKSPDQFSGDVIRQLADVKGDFSCDICLTSTSDVCVLSGKNGSIIWDYTPYNYIFMHEVYSCTISDLNNDGALEMVVSYWYGSKSQFFYVECVQLKGFSWELQLPWPTTCGSVFRTNAYPNFPNHPIANFSVNETLVEPNDTVQFNFTGFPGTEPSTFQWSFGDNSLTNSSQNPTHMYNASGVYTVSLMVVDSTGKNSTMTKVNLITVSIDIPPTVNFTCNTYLPMEGQSIQFTDLSSDPDGMIASWQWNFGDGTANSSLQNPVHIYWFNGTYTVKLTVTDNRGKKSTITKMNCIKVSRSNETIDPSGQEWPMFHGALNHTGVTSTTPLQGTGPIWSYSANGDVTSSPAVMDGQVFVGSDDSKVYCFNATTGTLAWSYETGSYVESSPAVVGGRVYVGSADSKIYCLDAITGTLVWSYITGGQVFSSPAVAGGYVYAESMNFNIYCLNATTGALVWKYATSSNDDFSSPAIAGGRLYVGSGSGDDKLYCLNATTGAFIWSYTMGDWVRSSPAVAGGRVYIGDGDSKVYCLNAITGTLIWSYTTGGGVESSPAIAGGRVYVGSENSKVYCLNATTGVLAWSYNTGSSIFFTSPAVANGRVYMGSGNTEVYCFDAISGAPIWSNYTGGAVESSPAVAGGRVYVGNDDGTIYCFPIILAGHSIPTAPQTLQATAGNRLISLAWTAPVNSGGSAITGYRVYGGTSSNGETLFATLGGALTYTCTGLMNGQVYYFKVVAINALGPGANSTEVMAIPTTVLLNSDPTGDEWPMFHGALNHTGVATTTPLQGTGPIWSYITGNYVASSPAVAGGRIFVGSLDDKLYCLNATTGAFIWSFTTGNWVESSPAIASNYVYIGGIDGNVYCLNATTGGLVWSYTTNGCVDGSPAVAFGRVYVGSNCKVYCLNALTGTYIWSYAVSYAVETSPSVVGGYLYVGDENSVYCLNSTTGAFLWFQATGNSGRSTYSSPTIAGGHVFIGGSDNKTYCLNATTGAFVWSYITGGGVDSSPAVIGGHVYIGSWDDKIYCLNVTTGALIWSYTTSYSEYGVISSPAVADGSVYVGSADSKIYCLNATTGAFIWSYATENMIGESSPAIAGGRVYIGSYDDKVYCLPMNLTITLTSPTAPRNAQAIASNGNISLTWQTPANNGGSFITGFKIYRGTSSGSETLFANIGNITTWTDTSVVTGQVYYYRVSAVNSIGEGNMSNEAIGMPATTPTSPQSFMTTAGNTQVVLNWAMPASNGGSAIANYWIYQGTMPNSETLRTTIGNVTTYTVTGLTNGHVYYFKVAAVNAMGTGLNSTETSATPCTVPGVPTLNTATPGNTQIILVWSAPASNGGSAITNYLVFRGTTINGEAVVATLGNVTSWNDTGLISGNVYYYEISAVNLVGEGPRSTFVVASLTIAYRAPVLSSPSVSPATGYPSTRFTFTVIYIDGNNSPPSFVMLHTGSATWSMTKLNPSDANFTDGCVFMCTITLAEGNYTYWFEANDGTSTVATPTNSLQVLATPEKMSKSPDAMTTIATITTLTCIGAIMTVLIAGIVVSTRKRYRRTNARIGNLLQSPKTLASDPGQPATAKQRALIASLLAEGRRTQLRVLPNEGLKQVSKEFARITSEPPLLARQRVLGEIETLKFMLDGDDLDAALHQAQSIVARLRLMVIDGQYSAEFKETMHGVASDIKRVIMAKLEHGRSGIGKQATTRALKARTILALLDDKMFTAGTSRAIDEFVPKGPVI